MILIGTCNHRDRLDPAILRAGRLDLHVEMPLPDEKMLAQILQKHLPEEDTPALEDLARRAVGHTPAELDAGIRAAKAAARQEPHAPTLADIARHLDLDDSDPAVTRRVDLPRSSDPVSKLVHRRHSVDWNDAFGCRRLVAEG
ncbi:ATP-binding protein [Frigidibacter sp. MR17.24]|uniref:ATP-binding protein n=1 Tax=Frigidibacter sp. MR17.24 TaxID=3127345 RepID=UPI003012DA1B